MLKTDCFLYQYLKIYFISVYFIFNFIVIILTTTHNWWQFRKSQVVFNIIL